MPTINSYCEVKTEGWNWVPVKILKEEGEIYTVKDLLTKNTFKENGRYIREIAIEQIHLDRIGFNKEFLNDIVAYRISFPVGRDLSNLALSYYGYSLFNKSEYESFAKHFYQMYDKIQKIFETDRSVLYDKNIRTEWNTIFTVNELFDILENKFGLQINNKENIITGAQYIV